MALLLSFAQVLQPSNATEPEAALAAVNATRGCVAFSVDGPPSPKHRVLLLAARTLNAVGQFRVTLSPR